MESSKPIIQQFSDRKSENGEALIWQVESLASHTAIAMCEDIKSTQAFSYLSNMIPAESAILYFEMRVREEIYSIIRDLCLIEWHLKNDLAVSNTKIILETRNSLANSLKKHWPSKTVSLHIDNRLLARGVRQEVIRQLYKVCRQFVKKSIIAAINARNKSLPPTITENTVAIHYTDEGVEKTSRSDLFWYHNKYISPDKILVFFDSIRTKSKATLIEAIQIIEDSKMHWVSLDNGRMGFRPLPYWKNNRKNMSLYRLFKRASLRKNTPWDRWIINTSKTLLADVDYWTDFYSFFKVKIHIDSEEGNIRGVSQRIALDHTGGIRIGKQRSENLGQYQSMLGFHPYHVFFLWGNRSIENLEHCHNRINHFIVCGYPFDYLFEDSNLGLKWRKSLTDHSVTFCIALFDEVFFDPARAKRLYDSSKICTEAEFRISLSTGIINEIPYSKYMLTEFYRSFLNLVIDNADVGIIIKSKKPEILHQLNEIHSTLKQALNTKRCVIADNPRKQIPAHASKFADISIGIGISTPISETVISGSKGLHYNCTNISCESFYQSRQNKFVFNDLTTLIKVVNKYKEQKSNSPGINDFAAISNQLDPFRDGQACYRIERYISDLLQSFNNGTNQDEALSIANSHYTELWGGDKVLSHKTQNLTPSLYKTNGTSK